MITLLRRLLVGFIIAVGVVVLGATAAGAGVLQETPPSAPAGDFLHLSALGVNILLAAVLPVVAGVLLRESNPEWVKVIGGIVVAGVAALITEAVRDDGTAVLSWDMFVTGATMWIAQIAAYLGIWKPLGKDTAAGSLNGALGPGVVPFERHPSASATRAA
jgi:hypothetical protein